MRLFWTDEAREDRRAIFAYVSADNPRAALALDQAFSDKARLLLDHPEIGRTGRVQGTREFVAHRNYLLVYDVGGQDIRILRVLHGARQWPVRA